MIDDKMNTLQSVPSKIQAEIIYTHYNILDPMMKFVLLVLNIVASPCFRADDRKIRSAFTQCLWMKSEKNIATRLRIAGNMTMETLYGAIEVL